MKIKTKHKLSRIIIYCLWLFFFINGVIDLFYKPYTSILWFSLVVILIFLYLKFNKIPIYAHLLLAVYMIPNLLGEDIFELFYKISFYDKILHFFSAIIIGWFIYEISKNKIKNKLVLIIFCTSISLSLALIWEIIEYAFDNIFNSVMQGVYLDWQNHFFIGIEARQTMDKLKDTMIDLISGIGGAAAFALGYYFYSRKKMLKINNRKGKIK